MKEYLKIKDCCIGPGHPCYVVAEMSANHNQSFDDAVKIIEAAKYAGANAIKLQTYTPDTLTIDCNNKYFQIRDGIWEGRSLYELYGQAYTPWEWHLRLKEIADSLSLDIFSTPFDVTAVDFLWSLRTASVSKPSCAVTNTAFGLCKGWPGKSSMTIS